MVVEQFPRQIDRLKALITTHFSDVRYPGDSVLLHPRYPAARVEIASFCGQQWNEDWKTVPPEVVKENYCSLLFFSSRAFRFYLPAYMTVALSVWPADPTDKVMPFILYSLNPESAERELYTHFLSQVAQLSARQKATVRQFVELLSSQKQDGVLRTEAEQAMQRYWSNVPHLKPVQTMELAK